MTDKALISELTWRSLAMQRAAFPDMPHYIAPDEIQEVLRPTTRRDALNIHVMSLAVIADTEKSFFEFITAARKRKAIIFDKENNLQWGATPNSLRNGIVKAWKMARKNGVAKIGGKISAEKREAESKIACDKIKDRWPLASSEWPTPVLLKEVDISYNTAIKFLGKRPIAQYNYQAKLKRKARRAA